MTVAYIVVLLVTGTVVGFAGGLLGLGGGFIMTPVQYMIFTDMGLSTDIAVKMAFGTNLAVVLPMAISGVWRHHRKGAVKWRVSILMGACGLLASFGGASLAVLLPGAGLKIAFGIVALAAGLRMLTTKPPRTGEEPRTNLWLLVAWAIPLGAMTGLLGIGGGVLAIPILVVALRFKIHDALGTSLAMMMLSSIGGIAGYIVNGLNVSGLPDYSLGYVNLPSWFLLTVTSVSLAQIGAVVAHRMPAMRLRYIFVAIMFYMGLRMLGLFEWLGWPL